MLWHLLAICLLILSSFLGGSKYNSSNQIWNPSQNDGDIGALKTTFAIKCYNLQKNLPLSTFSQSTIKICQHHRQYSGFSFLHHNSDYSSQMNFDFFILLWKNHSSQECYHECFLSMFFPSREVLSIFKLFHIAWKSFLLSISWVQEFQRNQPIIKTLTFLMSIDDVHLF